MMALLSIGAALTTYWWLVVAIGGALLVVGKFFLGWQLAKLLQSVFAFLRTPGGQVCAGVVVFFLVASSLVQWGRNIEKGRCDTAAKDARIEQLEKQVTLLTERQEYGAEVERKLGAKVAQDTKELSDLRNEVVATKLQSTKPGSKKDEKALLDDQCRYTDYGAKRVSAP
jgi:hypothetical protein